MDPRPLRPRRLRHARGSGAARGGALSQLADLRLPRSRNVARLLLPLDLLLAGWALLLHAHPQRLQALVLIVAALLVLLAFLIQAFAWVTLIAFFARERAHEGFAAARLLLLQLVCTLLVLWLVAPALSAD